MEELRRAGRRLRQGLEWPARRRPGVRLGGPLGSTLPPDRRIPVFRLVRGAFSTAGSHPRTCTVGCACPSPVLVRAPFAVPRLSPSSGVRRTPPVAPLSAVVSVVHFRKSFSGRFSPVRRRVSPTAHATSVASATWSRCLRSGPRGSRPELCTKNAPTSGYACRSGLRWLPGLDSNQ